MKAIVNADKNWGIGNKGKLLVSIPNDMKMFRNETQGKVVILGRKTLATFPQGLPLKNRTNIILTKDENFQAQDAIIVHSVEEVLEAVKEYPSDDVYVIGGDSVYRQLLPYCDTAIVTRCDQAYEADTYFPDLEKDPSWKMTGESDEQTYFSLEYTFQRWERTDQ